MQFESTRAIQWKRLLLSVLVFCLLWVPIGCSTPHSSTAEYHPDPSTLAIIPTTKAVDALRDILIHSGGQVNGSVGIRQWTASGVSIDQEGYTIAYEYNGHNTDPVFRETQHAAWTTLVLFCLVQDVMITEWSYTDAATKLWHVDIVLESGKRYAGQAICSSRDEAERAVEAIYALRRAGPPRLPSWVRPRLDAVCPRCLLPQPRGAFWYCDACKSMFDLFETHAVCPRCNKMWAETICAFCGEVGPHGAFSRR